MDKVILYATPVFFVLIVAELIWGVARGRNTYRLADTITSLGQGILSQVSGAFTRVFRVTLYALAFDYIALWRLPEDALWVWLFALLSYDFCYYWVHRSGHRVNAFWASHSVHHSSEDFNLGTALRQTSTGFWWTWIYYLPLAVLGVPPKVFAAVALIDLLYQFWVHTEHVGKLGWFDRVFVSPSNHRVHHGVNDAYVDKNYGGVLILWDRLFGTFEEERDSEPVVYGTRAPLATWNPFIVSWRIYGEMIAASTRTKSWGDKWRVWAKPPGWQARDAPAYPPFELEAFRRFEAHVSRPMQVYTLVQFLIGLAMAAHFGAIQTKLAFPAQLAYAGLVVVSLLCLGGLLENRRWARVLEVLRWVTMVAGVLWFGRWFG